MFNRFNRFRFNRTCIRAYWTWDWTYYVQSFIESPSTLKNIWIWCGTIVRKYRRSRKNDAQRVFTIYLQAYSRERAVQSSFFLLVCSSPDFGAARGRAGPQGPAAGRPEGVVTVVAAAAEGPHTLAKKNTRKSPQRTRNTRKSLRVTANSIEINRFTRRCI